MSLPQLSSSFAALAALTTSSSASVTAALAVSSLVKTLQERLVTTALISSHEGIKLLKALVQLKQIDQRLLTLIPGQLPAVPSLPVQDLVSLLAHLRGAASHIV